MTLSHPIVPCKFKDSDSSHDSDVEEVASTDGRRQSSRKAASRARGRASSEDDDVEEVASTDDRRQSSPKAAARARGRASSEDDDAVPARKSQRTGVRGIMDVLGVGPDC